MNKNIKKISCFFVFLLFFYLFFFQLSKPLFKYSIKWFIAKKSDSLYTVNFTTSKINIFTQSYLLTDFALDVDTNRLKTGQIQNKAYIVHLDTLIIKHWNVLKLFFSKNLDINKIFISNLKIKVYSKAKNDTISQYKNFSKVAVNSFFSFVNKIKIDFFALKHSSLSFLNIKKRFKQSFAAKDIAIIIEGIDIDKSLFVKFDKIFYKNLIIEILGYKLPLGDNIHILTAKSLKLNTAKKYIKIADLFIVPVNIPDSLKSAIFSLKINNLDLEKVDLKTFFEHKKLVIGKAFFYQPKFEIFSSKINKKSKKIDLKTIKLYPLYKKYLKEIQIDTIDISQAAFIKYQTLNSHSASLKIDTINIKLFQLHLDSLADYDTSVILYARNYNLLFNRLYYQMPDSVHYLYVSKMQMNSFDKTIISYGFYIRPHPWKRSIAMREFKSFNNISIPYLRIKDVNIPALVYDKRMQVRQLNIYSPNIKLMKFADTTKNLKKTTLWQLTKGVFKDMKISYLKITKGIFLYRKIKGNQTLITRGNIDLKLSAFYFSPYKQAINKFFFAQNVNLSFYDYNFFSTEQLHRIKIDSFVISTTNKQVSLNGFHFYPSYKNMDSLLLKRQKDKIFDFYLPQIKAYSIDINRFFTKNELFCKKVNSSSAQISMFYYPQISLTKEKRQKIGYLRNIYISQIVKRATNIAIKLYTSINPNNIREFAEYNQKIAIIDSLTKIANNTIQTISLPINRISISDRSNQYFETIRDTVLKTFNIVADSSLPVGRAYAKNIASFMNFYKKNIEKSQITQQEIVSYLSKFIRILKVDTLNFENIALKIINKEQNKKINFLQNSFDIRLEKFYFNADSVDSLSDRFLFADNFLFSISDLDLKMPDNIHSFKIKKLQYSSKTKQLQLDFINIAPRTTTQNIHKTKFYGYIPHIKINGFDINDWYRKHYINIKRLNIENLGLLTILKPIIKKKKIVIPRTLFLDNKAKKIKIDTLSFKNASVSISAASTPSQPFLSFSFNSQIFDIHLDSVLNIDSNLYFIPLRKFFWRIENFKYKNQQKKVYLFIDSLNYNSVNQNVDIKAFKVFKLNDLVDTTMKIIIPSLLINNLNINKLKKRHLVVQDLKIPLTHLFIHIQANKKKNNKKISDINLYSQIKKIFKTIAFSTIALDTIKLNIERNDTVRKIKNLAIYAENFLLNDTTKFYSPSLFYSKNFVLIYRDFNQFSKDSLYKYHFDSVAFISKEHKILLYNVQIKPIEEPEKILEKRLKNNQYRITVNDIVFNKISLLDFDFQAFIDSQKINIQQAIINGGKMFFYTDLRVPHNDTVIKKHFISLLFDIKKSIDIQSIIMRNIDLEYQEMSKATNKKGQIGIKKMLIKITNLTNDTLKIKKQNLYTVIVVNGYLQGSVFFNVKIAIDLTKKGNRTKISGFVDRTEATVFNTYTVNALNLRIDNGVINKITFYMETYDTIAIGRMLMLYDKLQTSLLKGDTLKHSRKFISFLANFFVLKSRNPKYGIFPKSAPIGYINPPSYSDIKLWVRGILSGVQASVAFESKDVKRIKRNYILKLNIPQFLQ